MEIEGWRVIGREMEIGRWMEIGRETYREGGAERRESARFPSTDARR
jgi:hypothetical protein